MKKIILLNILLILFSCKKEKLEEKIFLGEWTLISNAIINNNTYAIQNEETIGLKMIFDDGEKLNFSKSNMQNEFRVISISKENKEIDFISYDGKYKSKFKYTISIKKKNGGKFCFKYFSNDSDTIIGTFWIPNQSYITNDCPNTITSAQVNGNFQNSEIFGVYIK